MSKNTMILKRTIMIFPKFQNQEVIKKLREKYDPLAHLVRPHITLVFPFESSLSNEDLEKELQNQLIGIKPFHLVMSGLSKQEDKFGNYLFLNVQEGKENLIKINNQLYSGLLHKFDLGFTYVPHMTVGMFENVEDMNAAYSSCTETGSLWNSQIFETVVDCISVEMIGEHGESIIMIEKKL